MTNYQQFNVSSGELIGQPGPLPAQLVGLSDETLFDLSAHIPAAQMQDPTLADFIGMGFKPVEDPPAPNPTVIDRITFVRRFTAAEMVAIQSSEDPVVKNFLWELNLVVAVDLSNSDTINGVNYLEQTAKLIAAGRAVQILTP